MLAADDGPDLQRLVRRAAAIRAAILSIWLIVVWQTPYPDYADLPSELVTGMGIGRVLLDREDLLAWLWHPTSLRVLQGTAVVGCTLLLLLPWRLRWLTPVVCLVILVLDALTKGINGYANHAQIAPLFMLVLLALHTTTRFSLLRRPNERVDGAALETFVWLAGLLLVVPYAYIGLHRLLQGGVALFQGEAILDYIRLSSARYSNYGFKMFAGLVEIPWIAVMLKIGFLITTLFEVTSGAALRWKAYRYTWLIVMVGFHVMTLVTMNIFFWENLILLVVIFGPWPAARKTHPY